ncbi:integral membrane protein [Fusarium bulbicola]|nr:integral membrane protein [Fusarium bulbicola]
MPIDPSGPTVVATEWALISVATVVILARLYLRLILQRRSLLASDVLMCAAWASAVALASFDIYFLSIGIFKPGTTFDLAGFEGTAQEAENFYEYGETGGTLSDQRCTVESIKINFEISWVLNISADILIFILPWLVIPELTLRRRLRHSLYATFLLGLINIVFCVVRFAQIQQYGGDSVITISLVEGKTAKAIQAIIRGGR